jgi:hypothetical protein
MRFEHVAIAAVAHVLPDERVTSEALEARLARAPWTRRP